MLASLAPELKVLVINLVACAVGYFAIYPSFQPITWVKIMVGDAVISLAALVVAGLLFYGSGTEFWMFGVTANWAVFSIFILFAVEIPLISWFVATHDIEGGDDT